MDLHSDCSDDGGEVGRADLLTVDQALCTPLAYTCAMDCIKHKVQALPLDHDHTADRIIDVTEVMASLIPTLGGPNMRNPRTWLDEKAVIKAAWDQLSETDVEVEVTINRRDAPDFIGMGQLPFTVAVGLVLLGRVFDRPLCVGLKSCFMGMGGRTCPTLRWLLRNKLRVSHDRVPEHTSIQAILQCLRRYHNGLCAAAEHHGL